MKLSSPVEGLLSCFRNCHTVFQVSTRTGVSSRDVQTFQFLPFPVHALPFPVHDCISSGHEAHLQVWLCVFPVPTAIQHLFTCCVCHSYVTITESVWSCPLDTFLFQQQRHQKYMRLSAFIGYHVIWSLHTLSNFKITQCQFMYFFKLRYILEQNSY